MAERKTGRQKTAAPRKVAVVLEGEIRRRLRVYVAEHDLSQKQVFNEALDEYLKKRGA